jgi:threonine dehydrogenase-like Zn-dependent dehydrogenase
MRYLANREEIKMKALHGTAFAAIAAASQLLHAAPASATTISRDRHSTFLVARMLGDSRSARLALMDNDTAVAKTDISSALGISATFELCEQLVGPAGRIANIGVHGKPVTLHLEQLWNRNIATTTRLVDTSSTPMLLKTVR